MVYGCRSTNYLQFARVTKRFGWLLYGVQLFQELGYQAMSIIYRLNRMGRQELLYMGHPLVCSNFKFVSKSRPRLQSGNLLTFMRTRPSHVLLNWRIMTAFSTSAINCRRRCSRKHAVDVVMCLRKYCCKKSVVKPKIAIARLSRTLALTSPRQITFAH